MAPHTEVTDLIELRFWLWMSEQVDSPDIVAQAELTLSTLFGSVDAARRCCQDIQQQPVERAFFSVEC